MSAVLAFLLALLPGVHAWLVGRRLVAESSLEIACHATSIANDAQPFVCIAFDGTETHLWEVDPASGERQPLGSISGRHFAFGGAGEGKLATWDERHRLTVLDVARRRAERLAFSLPDRTVGVAFAGQRVGAVQTGEKGASLAIYDLKAIGATAIPRRPAALQSGPSAATKTMSSAATVSADAR